MLSCCAAGTRLSWARSGLGPNFAGNLLHCTANYFGHTGAPGGHIPQRPAIRRTGRYGMSRGSLDHSGLMPADLITLPHFSVSSAMNLPKSADEPASTVPPTSASLSCSFGSSGPAKPVTLKNRDLPYVIECPKLHTNH